MSFDRYQCERPSDEQLCIASTAGSPEAEEELVRRYTRLVRMCSRPLFLVGGDSEDLIQEGMFGLLTAIRNFHLDRDTSFRTFAEICIRNRLRSAVRASRREKHSPLNNYISFETPLFDGTTEYLFPSEESPESMIISREELKERFAALNSQLSSFEAEILSYYLDGLTCQEIAGQVDRTYKSVDNAVQRIRKKLARQRTSGVSSES